LAVTSWKSLADHNFFASAAFTPYEVAAKLLLLNQ
jgi:hypothetical protein